MIKLSTDKKNCLIAEDIFFGDGKKRGYYYEAYPIGCYWLGRLLFSKCFGECKKVTKFLFPCAEPCHAGYMKAKRVWRRLRVATVNQVCQLNGLKLKKMDNIRLEPMKKTIEITPELLAKLPELIYNAKRAIYYISDAQKLYNIESDGSLEKLKKTLSDIGHPAGEDTV